MLVCSVGSVSERPKLRVLGSVLLQCRESLWSFLEVDGHVNTSHNPQLPLQNAVHFIYIIL